MSDMAVGASWRAPPSAFRAFPTALSPRLDVSRSHIRPDKSFQVALVESCAPAHGTAKHDASTIRGAPEPVVFHTHLRSQKIAVHAQRHVV